MKPVLFLFVLLHIAIASFAQVGVGPEVGAGFSTYKFAPPTQPILYSSGTASPIFNAKAGVVMDVPLQKHIAFQAGVSFSRKGGVKDFSYYHNDSFNATVHQTLRVNYYDLPLNVLYKSGIQGTGRFVAGLGVTFSYIAGGTDMLNEHQVFNDSVFNTNGTFKLIPEQSLHRFDLAISMTAGYELATGLFFRAYYNVGFNNISTGSEIDKNRMAGIAAGYIWGRGRDINKEADDLIDKGTD